MIDIAKYRFFIAALLLIFGSCASISGQVISARAYIDNDSALVGDPLQMHLTIDKPAGVIIDIPAASDIFPPSVEITGIPVADTVTEGGRHIIDYSYPIAVFDTGYIEIPAIKIAFLNDEWDTISTLPVLLEIASLSLNADIKDIKEIDRAPVSIARLLPYIAGLALLAALIILTLRYYRRKLHKMPVRPENYISQPPSVTALNALLALQKEELWKKNRVKHYYIRLTEILRIYIEQEFNIAAPERTTDEIIISLRQSACDETALRKLDRILRVADLVKFAKLIPDDTENAGQINQAMDFVMKSRPENENSQDDKSVSTSKNITADAEPV